jgi:hypothetical protein
MTDKLQYGRSVYRPSRWRWIDMDERRRLDTLALRGWGLDGRERLNQRQQHPMFAGF